MASERPRAGTRLRRQLVVVGLVSVAVLFVLAVVIEGMLWVRWARSDGADSTPARPAAAPRRGGDAPAAPPPPVTRPEVQP